MSVDRPDRPDSSDSRLVDAALDAAWRAHSRETPSPELDAAILAAAHRASGEGPRDPALAEAREPERWWWPLAAAAVIGAVAFGVLQLLPPDGAGNDAVVTDMPRGPTAALPAPAAATNAEPRAARPEAAERAPESGPPPQSAANAARPREPAPRDKTEASSHAPLPAQPDLRREPRAFPGTPHSRPDAAQSAASEPSAPPPRGQGDTAAANRAAPSAGSAQSLAQPSPEPSRPPAPRARESGARSERDAVSNVGAGTRADITNAEPWIARIRAYRREGRESDAQAELRRFRAVDPEADARLPDDLKAWAASVPR